MNWNSVKTYFEDDGSLIDIYYEGMSKNGWIKLFKWLKSHENLVSIDCYDPISEKNIDYFPELEPTILNNKEFYCFVLLKIRGVYIFFRYYDVSELECDISPKEIDTELEFNCLLKTLATVQEVVSADRYIICPENFKEGVFNINGKFIS